MNYGTLIGSVAATLTTTAFLFQVIRTLKTRSTKDISLAMYFVMCTGGFLWLIYGILIKSWPLITANVISLSLVIVVLACKIKYG